LASTLQDGVVKNKGKLLREELSRTDIAPLIPSTEDGGVVLFVENKRSDAKQKNEEREGAEASHVEVNLGRLS
jgi:hypothetical protein